jgi:hypothetical protein
VVIIFGGGTMTDSTDDVKKQKSISDERLNMRIGRLISKIISERPELVESLNDLEKVCNSYAKPYSENGFERDGWKRNMMLAWAYGGCFNASIKGYADIVDRLRMYTGEIKATLEKNSLSDPLTFMPGIYSKCFDSDSKTTS